MTDKARLPDRPAAAESNARESPPDRRELVKKLGKAAALPLIVATFVASDASDAEAS